MNERIENKGSDYSVASIVNAIDRDVERGEDIIMYAFGLVMLSIIIAPLSKPVVILPFIALVFASSATLARFNYWRIQYKLTKVSDRLSSRDLLTLRPIMDVFIENPMPPLLESFNPFKNLSRSWKSVMGGIIINPLWVPIFYMMGMHIQEEKNLILLNKAIQLVEQRVGEEITVVA